MEKLSKNFYRRKDVLQIARELIGKVLVTNINGVKASGMIVEVEAYAGVEDKASHAYNNKRTKRNEMMYAGAGVTYIYLCYGLHNMVNVVTNEEGVPHAILIRALEPMQGIESMLQRTGKQVADYSLTRGPGNVAKAMGISMAHNGFSLSSKEINICSSSFSLDENSIAQSPRIGIDYAGDCKLLPYRFFVKENKYVSGKKINNF